MAVIRMSGIGVTEMRGRLGTDIFSRNQWGAYVKGEYAPTGAETPYQDETRVTLSDALLQWQGLNHEEQEAWNSAAQQPEWYGRNRFGQPFIRAGRSLFLHVNVSVGAFVPWILSPPSKRALVIPAFNSLELIQRTGPLILEVTFSTATITENSSIQFWATDDISAGISRPSKSAYRRFWNVPWDELSSPIDIGSEWETRFGTFELNRKVFVRCTVLDYTSGAQYQMAGGMVQS